MQNLNNIGTKFNNPKNLDCIGARSFEKFDKNGLY